MKFLIDYSGRIENKELFYNVEDASFDTEPSSLYINFDIVINKINLTVVDDDNRIVQLWGVFGYNEWIKANYNPPSSKIGILKIVDNLKNGLAYRINHYDYPIYVNVNTGWICIGTPEKKGNAVEFINNCIAVIDEKNEFVSLWLKPKIFSSIQFK